MFKAMLYRLAKSRLTRGFLLGFAAFELFNLYAVLRFVKEGFADAGALEVWGYMVVQGSVAAIVAGMFAACFLAQDFKDGFIKNYLQAPRARLEWAASAIAACIVASALTVAAGVAFVQLALAAFGMPAALPDVLDFIRWYAQVVLCVAAYAGIVAVVVAMTGSSAAGVVCAAALGFGAVETALNFVFSHILPLPDAVAGCINGYLAMDLAALSRGVFSGLGAYAEAGITLAVCAAALALVMRKRSVG